LVVAVVAIGTALLMHVYAVRYAWRLTLWGLMLYSIGSYVFLTLLIFGVNAVTAARQIQTLESEEEIEEVMVPALQGKSFVLGEKSKSIFQYLALLWTGVVLGAAIALAVERIF
jgi:hypothetical protein